MGRYPAWSPCRLSALPLLCLFGLIVAPRRGLTVRGATLHFGYLAPFSGEWKGCLRSNQPPLLISYQI